MLLAHALVRVDIGLAVGTCVCHIFEVIKQAGDQAAAEITPGAWEEAEGCELGTLGSLWAHAGDSREAGGCGVQAKEASTCP